MANDLDNLIRKSASDIEQRGSVKSLNKETRGKLPGGSVAFGIWLAAILVAIFGFSEVLLMFSGPTESKIEQDLSHVLETASGSLKRYETNSGVLPPILLNPAIRGLVKYERQSDFSFRLTATIGNVTMVMDSHGKNAYREDAEE